MNAGILIVTGPFASGKTRLAEYIAGIAGSRVVRIDSSVSTQMLRHLRVADPDLVIVDDFHPRTATAAFYTFLVTRGTSRTILTSFDPPSTWAAQARKPATRQAIAQIVANAQRVELTR